MLKTLSKKIKILSLLSVFLLVFLFANILLPAPALAQQVDPRTTYYGLDPTAEAATIDHNKSIQLAIGKIIRTVLQFIGVLLLVLIIIGGVLWMTAAGEEDKIKKAKGILTSAIIGLFIVISAYTITYFVMNELTKDPASGQNVIDEDEED
ncbi:hypothetical protein HQ544_00405 [Candidatus Falkowbacteria bacterium]|nr:hypothetical protein [Candidatus Falkowbacteria bacterium]